jgi:hypothetical protein
MEDEDPNDLVIEPMKTLAQKQVNEVLKNDQIKYGLNHSKPVVTLLPQSENIQSMIILPTQTIAKHPKLKKQ